MFQTEHQLQKLLILRKNTVSRGTKGINIEYFRKNNVSRGTHAKKHSLAHHFACHCKKIIIYGGYFCCFFLFHVKPTGVFGVILRFFGNFKPPKHMFACFFGCFM